MNETDLIAAANDPREFRRQLLIDTDEGPRHLADVADDWQQEDFAALDNGWRAVVGVQVDSGRPTFKRAYLERPRGHSKTNDLAAMCTWALFASRRQISGIAAAADKDQARLLRNAIERLTRLNPWLSQRVVDPVDSRTKPLVDAQAFRVKNTRSGSTLDIISSDAGSSYGILADFIIVDEVTNWASRDLWDSLLSAAAKRDHCMLVVISNAGTGLGTSWQWKLRESLCTDPNWYFHRLDGPVASWISQHQIAEQQRLLPPNGFRRLWLNQWCDDTGSTIDQSDLSAAIVFEEPVTTFDPEFAPYIASLDIGVRSDHSALVLFGLAVRGERARVSSVESWDPKKFGGRVPLHMVKQSCLNAWSRFRSPILWDPSQGERIAEELSEAGVPTIRFPWTVSSKQAMAITLIQAFRDREIDLLNHPGLLRDLRKISILERNGRWTMLLPSDEDGHCDIGAAFCQGLPFALSTRRSFLGLPATELEASYQALSV